MKRLLSLCLAISLSLFVRGGAHAVDSTQVQHTDYMACMIAAATTGAHEAGRLAETQRNQKIDDLALPYAKISYDELFALARIIYAEAGCTWLDDTWRMCVGEVVLNRVASPEFPDTLDAVLAQPGQYYGNSAYFLSLLPTEHCVQLALRLLQGERVMDEPSVVFQANVVQGSGICLALHDPYLGSTYFCYSYYPSLYEGGESDISSPTA